MSRAGYWLAKDRGLRDLTPDNKRGLDVAARLRQAHKQATIRPVRVTTERTIKESLQVPIANAAR